MTTTDTNDPLPFLARALLDAADAADSAAVRAQDPEVRRLCRNAVVSVCVASAHLRALVRLCGYDDVPVTCRCARCARVSLDPVCGACRAADDAANHFTPGPKP